MTERAQWLCELAGGVSALAGLVVVGAAFWGALGAGLALLVAAVPLIVAGNLRRGDS
ncbi:hypothetical protein ACFVH0_36025 [Streptomyces sp. NPDC127117]|uniref:hypothetical protein n=1 Tax=Streptomyces sp. NPDC127117 TaxID=3345368 RepID=UPI0036455B3E